MEPIKVHQYNRTAYQQALKLHAKGWAPAAIAREVGRKRDTVVLWLSPTARAKKAAADKRLRRERAKAAEAGQVNDPVKLPKAGLTFDDLAKRRADMAIIRRLNAAGPDTRDLTGRIYGDPLPHRSALATHKPQTVKRKIWPIVPYETEVREDGMGKRWG